MSKPYVRYGRLSRLGYRERGQNVSITEQDRDTLAIAHRFGLPTMPAMIPDEDESGASFARPGWERALALVRNGEAAGIIAFDLKRMTRGKTAEVLMMVEDVEAVGGALYDGSGRVSVESADDELVTTVKAMIGRREWRERRAYLEASRRQAIERGAHPHERFGYRKDQRGVLEPYEVEAVWVPRIFERRAAGTSWPQLAEWLNSEGVLPHTFSARRDGAPCQRTQGTRWRHNTVKALTESRVYLGEARSGEFVNATAHPPLVSIELFEKVAALRDLRPRRGAAEYELGGIVRCAKCGLTMRGNTDRKGERVYRYYRCQQGASCGLTKKVKADVLEAAVQELFADVVRGMRAYAVERTGSLDVALSGLVQAERTRDEIAADLELMQASRPAYLAAVAEAEQRVTQARSDAQVMRQRVTGVSITDEELRNWSALGIDARRRFLAEAFEVVYVSVDRTGWAPLGRGELADPERVLGSFLPLAER